MKTSLVLAAAMLVAACHAPATPPVAPLAVSGAAPILHPTPRLDAAGASRLELQVERLWNEDGFAFANVRVRNTASHDLVKITVECSAIDPAGPTPRTARETVLDPSEQPLSPGTERTRRVSFGRCGPVESMTCEARAL